MKQIGYIFTALTLAATLLSGCDANANKTALIYGKLLGELNVLNYEELSDKLDNGDNFLLFQTPNSNCTCWTSFRDSILKPYIIENNVRAYTIPFAEFYDSENIKRDTFGIALNSSSQTMAIYKDGVIKTMREYNSTHKIWTSSESFNTYINELIITPTIIDLDLAQLQSLYTKENPFSVLFYDESEASLYLKDNPLKDYALAHLNEMETIYALQTNVEGIKLNDSGIYQDDQWQTFKDDYGLSSLNNEVFGYGDGFVPTLQYIEPNGGATNGDVIKAQVVYFNDLLANVEVDGSYLVEDSYYTTERQSSLSYLNDFSGTAIIKGLTIPSSDTKLVGEQRVWLKEKAAVYHDPLLAAFLDYTYAMSV